ncbi:putative F420-dependent oxidoreductase [Actinomycetospora cinnamomea]|uniref:Putative F420-dependent oxidoreductase n=1 Tax=Actinomycetospora cinnamomea TaxID=663609 RepID=A0A2U1F8G5_9PSEU|nr:putative F420-dependent oxidoreductase [Actinomycetospora cinnamomea]
MKVRLGIGTGSSRATPAEATASHVLESDVRESDVGESDVRELVDGSEARGIDSVWFPDRIAAPSLEPLVALGWAAGRTRSLKLGTGVVVLPGRNPAVVAAQLASLAALAPRRIPPVFGLRSATAAERTAYPVTGPRAEVFEESLTAVRRLLSEESVTFRGRHVVLEDATVGPRPARPLDLWLGGLVPAALRRVGHLGDGWVASFVTPAEAGAARATIAAAAREAGREVEDDHYGTNLLVLPPGAADDQADRARAAAAHRRPEVDPRELVADGWDAARRQVERFVDEGITKFVVRPGVAPGSWSEFLDGFVEHSSRSRRRSAAPQHPGDRDLQHHAARVLPRRAVALRVAAFGVGDAVGVVADHRPPLERRPPRAVDLADRHPCAVLPCRAHVAGLRAGARGDDAGGRGVQVERDAHGHDVRRPVAAQGRQRAQVVLGPELRELLAPGVQVGRCDGHGHDRARLRRAGDHPPCGGAAWVRCTVSASHTQNRGSSGEVVGIAAWGSTAYVSPIT